MSANLNEVQNALVGATVGMIEVIILQPFNYAKNMVQQGEQISLNALRWYRGVGANVINMGSCTMIQFAVGGSLKKLCGKEGNISAPQEMLCGIGAGTVSAFVGSPLELIMIQQQKKGNTTLQAVKSVATPSLILRGFEGMAVREALWTCGYLSIPPIVRRELRERYPDTFPTDNKARVPAALLGGLFACYLTQPFDTMKTCMQGDIERKKFGTLTQTGRILFQEAGIFAFYRGATFRYGRMCCAVFLMDYLKGAVSKVYYPDAF